MDVSELLDQAIELLGQAQELGKTISSQVSYKAAPPTMACFPIKVEEIRVARVYWAGSRGLADLSRELGTGQRVDKIGISTEIRLDDRLAILGQDRYGSIRMTPDGTMVEHRGFERWIAQAIHITRPPRRPEITISARTIDVGLPEGLTRRQFDIGLRRGLSAYAAEKQGVRCFTSYSGVDRVSRATEFVVGLDPRRNGDLLLEIVEAVLDAHGAGAVRADFGPIPLESGQARFAPKIHRYRPFSMIDERRPPTKTSRRRWNG
jgi:hypothetical protein